jgi:hypothetical protein
VCGTGSWLFFHQVRDLYPTIRRESFSPPCSHHNAHTELCSTEQRTTLRHRTLIYNTTLRTLLMPLQLKINQKNSRLSQNLSDLWLIVSFQNNFSIRCTSQFYWKDNVEVRVLFHDRYGLFFAYLSGNLYLRKNKKTVLPVCKPCNEKTESASIYSVFFLKTIDKTKHEFFLDHQRVFRDAGCILEKKVPWVSPSISLTASKRSDLWVTIYVWIRLDKLFSEHSGKEEKRRKSPNNNLGFRM